MAELFKDIIPAILQTKQVVIDETNETDYVPFIVNKALSFHKDCVFYANEMNKYHDLPKILQNQYYLNTVRAWKRPFQKWQKLEKDDNIDIIMEYYGMSRDKAKEAFKLLTDDQINTLRGYLDKGGLNAKSKRTNRGQSK